MEEDIQEKFHLASVTQIQTCVPEVTSPKPLPREITAVFRFDDKVLSIVHEIQNEFKNIEPSIFYYPLQQLHMTILGKMSKDTNLDDLEEVIRTNWPKDGFLFHFWGTGMGKFSSSISAYPVNFSLHDLRDQLRNVLNISGTDFTIHLPEYEYVGWINFSRNVDSIPGGEYRAKILEYCEKEFGFFKPIAVDCLINESWVLDPTQSKIIKRIEL